MSEEKVTLGRGKYIVYIQSSGLNSGFASTEHLRIYGGKLPVYEGYPALCHATPFDTYEEACEFRKRCIQRNKEKGVKNPCDFLILQTAEEHGFKLGNIA